jgi:CBS domain-containing protein
VTDARRRSGCGLGLGTGIFAIVAVLLGWFVLQGRAVPGIDAGFVERLEDRGRVGVIGGADLLRLSVEGVELRPVEALGPVATALEGTDEAALAEAMQEAGVAGLLVDGRGAGDAPEGASLRQRLEAYETLAPLQALALSPTAAFYRRRRPLELEPPLDRAVARVARELLGGARLPSVSSFPEALRRNQSVEVLVLLERGTRPRLWRSARSASIARGLMTAATVARQRWQERERAMGGSLDDQLRRLGVRVFLLEEDGTLYDRSPAFVERVFDEGHGVALEQRGSWHYLLPSATRERGEGSAMTAYTRLLEDIGLPEDALETRTDLRLYRLVAHPIAYSPAEPIALPPPRPRLDEELEALFPDGDLTAP